jgi:ribonuclease P protein component
MITRSHRFHGYGSLRYIYRNGKTVRGPLSSLKYIQNKRRKSYRLSVVVNKKVNKSAVVRNRIRRRIYEIVRQTEALINEPYDLVFTIFSDQINGLSPDELNRLVKAQLFQAGVITSKNNMT